MPLKVVCSLKKKILTLLEDKKHQHTFNWVKFAVSKAVLLLPTQELLGYMVPSFVKYKTVCNCCLLLMQSLQVVICLGRTI